MHLYKWTMLLFGMLMIIYPHPVLHAQTSSIEKSIGDAVDSRLKEIVQPKNVWGYIDRWFEKTTGITIAETWRVIKEFFLKIFDFIIWLFKSILSAFKWLWHLVF